MLFALTFNFQDKLQVSALMLQSENRTDIKFKHMFYLTDVPLVDTKLTLVGAMPLVLEWQQQLLKCILCSERERPALCCSAAKFWASLSDYHQSLSDCRQLLI